MYIRTAFILASSALRAVSASPVYQQDVLKDLQDQATATLSKAATTEGGPSACNVFSAHVRKDWDTMAAVERISYTKAVNCLMSKPSKLDPTVVPGAKSRYDDFVAQHINQTLSIHGTGNFLSWHRYFLWSYETALREECQYQGYQPYWNWFSYQSNPTESPVFDGSDTSMSGDGAFVAHNGSVGGAGAISLPSGNGGGCITSGPFKDMKVNLGPVSPTMAGETKVPDRFAWNPRCLKRDLSAYTAEKWLIPTNLLNLTTGPAASSIETFQNELQGRFPQGFLGLHAGGHFMIGGDAGDLYSSPAFTVAGTITLFNNPPSRNTTLEDPIYMGQSNAPERPISQLLNTLGGEPLCYTYL
ncbi:hypothetical protein PG994_012118 [Apiospora phragmitis]|uniref:Tyrosinase copper-binding domain-containing protein n=1 Tax=Apiospora phragmitis TaxID=2905665 RepID=A0ABR1TXC8_9PEZI